MVFHTTDTICALTGASLSNLRHWQRFGLIQSHPSERFWTDGQLSEIRQVMLSSALGATAREISANLGESKPLRSYGWCVRRGEMLDKLESGSDRALARLVRCLSRDFSGDDFVRKLMKPLGLWLRHDERAGSAIRLVRFQDIVELHAINVARASHRAGSPPLLLEITDSAEETDVLLEVIRLTAQGFCVDVFDPACGPVYSAVTRSYEHHLVWAEEGLVFKKSEEAHARIPLAG